MGAKVEIKSLTTKFFKKYVVKFKLTFNSQQNKLGCCQRCVKKCKRRF